MTYLVPLKAAIVETLKATFAGDYPEEDFKGTHVSIEYPVEPQHYPGVWVDYNDLDRLTIAGIDHTEYGVADSGSHIAFTRWKFSGTITFTCVALSSLERDRLFDEIVRIFAFGQANPETSQFRRTIESNDFVALNLDFDTLEPRAGAAAPGTPWESDEIIYERSIDVNCLGEFVVDKMTGGLVLLSKITVEPTEVLSPPGPPDTSGGWQ